MAYEIIQIETRVLTIRGQKIMVDEDLALLYDIPTKVLIQTIKRNKDRFPEDFMFQINQDEYTSIEPHLVKMRKGRGGRRYLPYAFTEQGVAMLSSVLNSDRAVRVNIEIMRVFVRLRHVLLSSDKVAQKLDELEKAVETHDKQIQTIFSAIRQLITPEQPPKRRIGFGVDNMAKEKTSDIDGYTAKFAKIKKGYMGQLVEWPEVLTEGKTLSECRILLRDALQEMIAGYKKLNKPIPKPVG